MNKLDSEVCLQFSNHVTHSRLGRHHLWWVNSVHSELPAGWASSVHGPLCWAGSRTFRVCDPLPFVTLARLTSFLPSRLSIQFQIMGIHGLWNVGGPVVCC